MSYLLGASWEWVIFCWSSPCTVDSWAYSTCPLPPPMQSLLATSSSGPLGPVSAPLSATLRPCLYQRSGQTCFWFLRLSLLSFLSELGTWWDVERGDNLLSSGWFLKNLFMTLAGPWIECLSKLLASAVHFLGPCWSTQARIALSSSFVNFLE